MVNTKKEQKSFLVFCRDDSHMSIMILDISLLLNHLDSLKL